MKYHIVSTDDQKSLCRKDGFLIDPRNFTLTSDPMAAAVKAEDQGKDLCLSCRKSLIAHGYSIKRWLKP